MWFSTAGWSRVMEELILNYTKLNIRIFPINFISDPEQHSNRLRLKTLWRHSNMVKRSAWDVHFFIFGRKGLVTSNPKFCARSSLKWSQQSKRLIFGRKIPLSKLVWCITHSFSDLMISSTYDFRKQVWEINHPPLLLCSGRWTWSKSGQYPKSPFRKIEHGKTDPYLSNSIFQNGSGVK